MDTIQVKRFLSNCKQDAGLLSRQKYRCPTSLNGKGAITATPLTLPVYTRSELFEKSNLIYFLSPSMSVCSLQVFCLFLSYSVLSFSWPLTGHRVVFVPLASVFHYLWFSCGVWYRQKKERIDGCMDRWAQWERVQSRIVLIKRTPTQH